MNTHATVLNRGMGNATLMLNRITERTRVRRNGNHIVAMQFGS